AALAGAGVFRFPSCNDATIVAKAQEYGGDTYNTAPTTGTVAMAVNQPAFPGSSTVEDADLAGSPGPCTANFVDVKLSETDVPWFFRAAGFDAIHAQARVSLMDVSALDDLSAIGVEESSPRRIQVTFVNEETGASLGSAALRKRSTAGGLELWDNATGAPDTGPVTITSSAPRIGVRIAMSGSTSTITCGQPLVLCYGGEGTTVAEAARSMARVRSHGAAPTGSPSSLGQMVRDVSLAGAAGCAVGDDGFFHTGCTKVRVTARLSNLPATMRGNDVLLVSAGGGAQVAMTPIPPAGTTMQFAADVTVPSGGGPYAIDLEAQAGTINGKTCKKNNNDAACKAGDVHRGFRATRETAGPISRLTVLNEAAPADPPNTVSDCATACTRQLVVSVGIAGSNALTNADGDPVRLRTVGQNQPGSVQCSPELGGASGLGEMLAKSCGAYRFKRNDGTPCPSTTSALFGTSAPWTAQPWSCIPVITGNKTNVIADGLNRRILCPNGSDCSPSTCTSPQAWPNYSPTDKRLVRVVLVPFGSFDGKGSAVVPITGFA
ncbi:MAG: hypothetical protein ACLGI3_05300, partial [Actinomycetes bacterium]